MVSRSCAICIFCFSRGISLGCANARQAGSRALWFYPTIGAAIAGGLPWLNVRLGCGQLGSVDLRTLDRQLDSRGEGLSRDACYSNNSNRLNQGQRTRTRPSLRMTAPANADLQIRGLFSVDEVCLSFWGSKVSHAHIVLDPSRSFRPLAS